MSEDPIVFARAESQPSARSVPWGATTCTGNGGISILELRERVRFDTRELKRILDLYGAMVMAGEWRDYAIDFRGDVAVFSVFRRSCEMPIYTIEKRPRLKDRQGQYAIIAAGGRVLKRGHDLSAVLRVLHIKLVKVVE
jgi:hypothetical protein